MAFGPPVDMKVPRAVIPSEARNLLLMFFRKSRFFVATLPGMSELLDDVGRAKRGIWFCLFSTRNTRCLATLGMTAPFFISLRVLRATKRELVPVLTRSGGSGGKELDRQILGLA